MQRRYQNEARKDSNVIISFGKQQNWVCVCQRAHIDLQVGSYLVPIWLMLACPWLISNIAGDFLIKWLNVNKGGRHAILGYNLFRSPDYIPAGKKGKYIFLMAISLSVSDVYQTFHLPVQEYSNIIRYSVPTVPPFSRQDFVTSSFLDSDNK